MAENVFVSWSGDTSHAVAEALHEWLHMVIHAVRPWVSSKDIDKGTQWRTEISVKLKEMEIGVICLTPDNLRAPWLLFEAGALSKTVDHARVCTYLIGVEHADIEGPLALFNHTNADKDDTKKMLATINKFLGSSALRDEELQRSFEKWWPDLETKLHAITTKIGKAVQVPKRSDREILEEILEIVRSQARQTEKQQHEEAIRRLSRRVQGPGMVKLSELANPSELSSLETLKRLFEKIYEGPEQGKKKDVEPEEED